MNKKNPHNLRKTKGQRKGWSTLKTERLDWEQRLNVVVEVKAHVSPVKNMKKSEGKLQSQFFLIP
ncbi:hypothetical protein Aoki45_33170 [Algoriphagus sp. oki45]|nr:hypothetical protein Aoki45_33170 [Algoriphagus sp. oki45]